MNDTAAQPKTQFLYQKEAKVYPRDVSGRFVRLRRLAMIVLLGAFYVGPFLTWGGRQAILFNLVERKFYIFGLTLWPQDFIFLALLLIMAALSLFFFTAVAGRLWCGYACPQTVWTEAFALIERAFEGNRSKRMKLDRGPWNWNRIWRKAGKEATWIALALLTGFCFVAYFTPAAQLARDVLALQVSGWSLFWILFYGFATYGNAGHMREQVCKYMCPYARFQSSMFDKDTLIITYDAARGEPRGGRSRKAARGVDGLGDCIDCTLCVQVCPTGIDIRKGLQYECIACAACIDACDTVMDKMGFPRGLVRYTTEHAIAEQPTRLVRPRILVYATLLTVLATAFIGGLATRPTLIVDVMRDRNALYRDVGREGIENTYSINAVNKLRSDRRFEIQVSGVEGARIATPTTVEIGAESVQRIPVAVRVPHEHAAGGQRIEFTFVGLDDDDTTVTEDSRFRGPTVR